MARFWNFDLKTTTPAGAIERATPPPPPPHTHHLTTSPLRPAPPFLTARPKLSPAARFRTFGPPNPPPSRAGRSPPPSPQTPAYAAPIGSPVPEKRFLRVSFAKAEPPRLGFAFMATTSPPSRLTQSHPTTTSTTAYPAPIGSPLPEKKPPRVSFAKTEPPQLGFAFLATTSTPLHLAQSHPPTTSTPAYPAPIGSPLPERKPLRVSFAKAEPPRLRFGFLPQTARARPLGFGHLDPTPLTLSYAFDGTAAPPPSSPIHMAHL